MRVTIVAEDNLVYVEGQAERVDCSSLDEEIHAIQWYDGRGEIEYKTDYVTGDRKMNFCIVDFASYQHLVDAWMIEAKKVPPPPPGAPTTTPSDKPVHVIAN